MTRILITWTYAVLGAFVLTAACKKNQVPEGASVPSGPSSGHPDRALVFTSSATDPDDDSVAVRFDWGDGDTSAWSVSLAGGALAADSHSWAVADTFLVRAQARDARGALSGWSNAHSVSILTPHPPSTPEVHPWSHSAVAGDSLGVVFHLEDLDGDSVAVRMAWGDGDTADWSEFYSVPGGIQFDHSWQDTGTYLITAQAKDMDGLTSEWSEPCSINVWQPKWRYKTGLFITSSPAIAADGTVYVGSFDHYLYALNPNGTLRWRYEAGEAIWSAPAIGADGTIYVGAGDSLLYAIRADGTLKWRYGPAIWMTSTPAVGLDATLYFALGGLFCAVDSGGRLKWSRDIGTSGECAIGADGTIYVGSSGGALNALNPSGALKWSFPISGYIHSSPAIAADGTVYVGSDDKSLYAIDSNGVLKWQYFTRGQVQSSPSVGPDGTIYVGSGDHRLYAIEPDGALKWSFYTDGSVCSSPALAADGTAYVGSEDGCLYAIDQNGMLKWRVVTGVDESSPAIADDGTVYVGSNHSCYLYAIRGNSPLADAPWPKFHHDAMNTGCVGGR